MEQGASTGHDDDSLGAEQEEQQEQEQSHTDKGGPSAAGKSPSTATALGPAWTQAKPNKNYDLAARALFDDRMVRGGGKGAESGQNGERSSIHHLSPAELVTTAPLLIASPHHTTPSPPLLLGSCCDGGPYLYRVSPPPICSCSNTFDDGYTIAPKEPQTTRIATRHILPHLPHITAPQNPFQLLTSPLQPCRL